MSYEAIAKLSGSDKALNKLSWSVPPGELLSLQREPRSAKPVVVYELGKAKADSLVTLDDTLPSAPKLTTAVSTPVLSENKSWEGKSPALTPLPVSPGFTFQDLDERLSDVEIELADNVFEDINEQQLKQDQQEVTYTKELLTQAVTYSTVQNQGPQVAIEEGIQGPPPVVVPPIAVQIPPVVIQPLLPPQVNLPAPQNNDQILHPVNNTEPEDEMSEERTITPPTFAGKPEEDASDWLRHFQNYCTYKGYNEQKTLQLFKVLMVHNAALWLDALTETVAGDFTQLIAAFNDRYKTHQILKYRYSQELFNRRQQDNESVDDFIAHLKKLSRIVEAEEKMTIMAIMNGLKPNIKLYVMQQKPENLDALLQAARVAEVTAPPQSQADTILKEDLAEMKMEMKKIVAKIGQISVSTVNTPRQSPELRERSTERRVSFEEPLTQPRSSTNWQPMNPQRGQRFGGQRPNPNPYRSQQYNNGYRAQRPWFTGVNAYSRGGGNFRGNRPHMPQNNGRQPTSFQPNGQCLKCGQFGGHTHPFFCPAINQTCNYCNRIGHWARVCRSTRGGQVMTPRD